MPTRKLGNQHKLTTSLLLLPSPVVKSVQQPSNGKLKSEIWSFCCCRSLHCRCCCCFYCFMPLFGCWMFTWSHTHRHTQISTTFANGPICLLLLFFVFFFVFLQPPTSLPLSLHPPRQLSLKSLHKIAKKTPCWQLECCCKSQSILVDLVVNSLRAKFCHGTKVRRQRGSCWLPPLSAILIHLAVFLLLYVAVSHWGCHCWPCRPYLFLFFFFLLLCYVFRWFVLW